MQLLVAITLAASPLLTRKAPLLTRPAPEAALVPNAAPKQVEGGAGKPTPLDVAPRHDFSGVAMTYLGRNRVLSFNQWNGEYSLWQYGTPRQKIPAVPARTPLLNFTRSVRRQSATRSASATR